MYIIKNTHTYFEIVLKFSVYFYHSYHMYSTFSNFSTRFNFIFQ